MAHLATQSEIVEQSSSYAQTTNTNSEYAFTPYPSLTLSQRLELNKILHTNDITNNNVSTFSDQDIMEPEQLTTNEEQKEVMGCCTLM